MIANNLIDFLAVSENLNVKCQDLTPMVTQSVTPAQAGVLVGNVKCQDLTPGVTPGVILMVTQSVTPAQAGVLVGNVKCQDLTPMEVCYEAVWLVWG